MRTDGSQRQSLLRQASHQQPSSSRRALVSTNWQRCLPGLLCSFSVRSDQVAGSISHDSIHGPTITPRPCKSSPQKHLQTFRVQFQYSLSFVGLLLDPEGCGLLPEAENVLLYKCSWIMHLYTWPLGQSELWTEYFIRRNFGLYWRTGVWMKHWLTQCWRRRWERKHFDPPPRPNRVNQSTKIWHDLLCVVDI